jgi:hypothetical protein
MMAFPEKPYQRDVGSSKAPCTPGYAAGSRQPAPRPPPLRAAYYPFRAAQIIPTPQTMRRTGQ